MKLSIITRTLICSFIFSLMMNITALAQDSPQTARKVVIGVTNASVTGTTRYRLAKLTGAPSTAVIAATSDTDGIIGIVTANAGTSNTATIQVEGQVSCEFDGATTAGNYVQISSSTAGKCHDTGSATYPLSGQVLGRVLSTNGGAGTYTMLLAPQASGSAAGDVQGPGSSTDNAIARFDGATGKVVQNSGVTVDDSNNLSIPGNGLFQGQYNGALHDDGSSSTAITIDWNDSNVQYVTMTDNATFTFSNPVSGGRYVLLLKQDGTGSRTATWPAAVLWPGGAAPTLTTTAAKVDIVTFVYDGVNAKYYGGSVLNF